MAKQWTVHLYNEETGRDFRLQVNSLEEAKEIAEEFIGVRYSEIISPEDLPDYYHSYVDFKKEGGVNA